MTIPRIWYDYTLQAWVEDGRIAECGHINKTVCYACKHAGELADESHYIDD